MFLAISTLLTCWKINNYIYISTMTLKKLNETIDDVRWSADRHYIDCLEKDGDIGAKQEDCRCSAKSRTTMKKRILRYY